MGPVEPHWETVPIEAMNPGNPPLVFVNKAATSRSLSRSHGSERTLILSHTQQTRRRRGSSKSVAEPWSKYTNRLAVRQRNALETRNDDNGSGRYRSSLLNTLPSSNSSDPFHCTVAGFDAGSHSMLRFTFGKGAKSTFLAEAFAPATRVSEDTPMRHSKIMDERMRRCVEDEALMYSTLAYGACCQGWMAGIINEDQPPEYFIGRALDAVRMRLSDLNQVQVDDWMMISIYSLAITQFWNSTPILWTRCPERYAAMLEAGPTEVNLARTHLDVMMKLAAAAGGWDKFDPYILESAILADKFLAIFRCEAPTIPFKWDPGPLHVDMASNVGLKTTTPLMGTRFRSTPIAGTLQETLQNIIEYITFAEAYWRGKDRPDSLQRHLFLRLQALTCSLLSLTGLDCFNDSVRLSAMIFLLTVTDYHGAQTAIPQLLTRLQASLVAAHFWEDGFDEGVRLWCLITAAMTTKRPSDVEWFRLMTERFLRISPVWNALGSLQERMCKYLFLPSRQASYLMRLRLGMKPAVTNRDGQDQKVTIQWS